MEACVGVRLLVLEASVGSEELVLELGMMLELGSGVGVLVWGW
jgi:hypothetical protein